MTDTNTNQLPLPAEAEEQIPTAEAASVPIEIDQPIEELIQIKPQQPQKEKFIESNPEMAEKLKAEGNELFKNTEYVKAIDCYQSSLRYVDADQAKMRCVLYSNISICLSKGGDYKDMVQYCKKAVVCDPTYLKAQLNLAIAYEKTDNPEQALAQYKKVRELNPKDVSTEVKIKQLQKKVEELNEKRKTEVVDGLKKIGNSILGYFGMSLDNFKLNQGENGGYNVSFKN